MAGGLPAVPARRQSRNPQILTRAVPLRTSTSGARSCLGRTVTTGLLPGGGGGSETSAVSVPASLTNRTRTVAAGDLDAAAGPIGFAEGDERRRSVFAEAVRNGKGGKRPLPRAGVGALAHGGDESVGGVVRRLPAFAFIGLLDGSPACLLQRLRLDGDRGREEDGVSALNGVRLLHDAASAAASPRVTVTLRSRTAMSTARSRGKSQNSSRETASAMETRRASSSEQSSLVAM